MVCRGLPLKVRVTSMMFEDRSGYQIFTVRLGPADVIADEAKFRSLPDIMMERITTIDDGPPLYIRCVVCVCVCKMCVCDVCVRYVCDVCVRCVCVCSMCVCDVCV